MSAQLPNEDINRILREYTTTQDRIKDKLLTGAITQERLDELHKALDVEMDEYCRFQELKTLAVAEQIITPLEGMTVFESMGTSPEVFNRQPLHVKAALTTLFTELLHRRMKKIEGGIRERMKKDDPWDCDGRYGRVDSKG